MTGSGHRASPSCSHYLFPLCILNRDPLPQFSRTSVFSPTHFLLRQRMLATSFPHCHLLSVVTTKVLLFFCPGASVHSTHRAPAHLAPKFVIRLPIHKVNRQREWDYFFSPCSMETTKYPLNVLPVIKPLLQLQNLGPVPRDELKLCAMILAASLQLSGI